MSKPHENFTLPELARQIQAAAEEKKNKGNAASFVRISDATRDWMWREGRRDASPDMQETMDESGQPESLQQIVGLRIQIDNSLNEFQFIVG